MKERRPSATKPTLWNNAWTFGLGHRWTWQMAWRDSRRGRRRLLLFSSAIVIGIGTLVAVSSFGRSLENAIDEQAKTLLGADLSISSRTPFSSAAQEWLASLPVEQARQIGFASMISFPGTEGTRLVRVRALEGGYPFYGELETTPESALADFRAGKGALVEESLLIQFDAQPGDTLRIGELNISVAGGLRKVPGETIAFSTMAPRVYLPMEAAKKTGLLGRRSLARFQVYLRLDPQQDVATFVERIKPELNRFRLRHETIADRKEEFGESLDNLYRFLNLTAFIALLLGGIGIASATELHVKEKRPAIAVLRCLGTSVPQTLGIYFAQAVALGLLGLFAGTALGLAVQGFLPAIVEDFVPFEVRFRWHWAAIAQAGGVGFTLCLLFALRPLLEIRKISPLAVVRTEYGHESHPPRDWVYWTVHALLGATILLFAMVQSDRWWVGLGIGTGVLAVFAVLLGAAHLLLWTTKRLMNPGWRYRLRQGISNLYRPNNRSTLLLLSLGLGTFLILTLYLVHANLLEQLLPEAQTHRPNAILFEIQPEQRDDLRDLLTEQGLPLLDTAPVVSMQLASVKGIPVDQLLAETNNVPEWVLRRQYRSTYRGHLTDSEKLVVGKWIAEVPSDAEVIPVSLERDLAEDLGVGLSDHLVFNVQGLPIEVQVVSLREVDWRQVRANFFVVFPQGVLEMAPRFFIFMTHVADSHDSARLQRAVVQAFPNISVIDLTLILRTLDDVLSRASFAIRFMALFTVATGLLLLVASIWAGRHQRIQESVLLRTLGASKHDIRLILITEYAALGLLSSFLGIILALGAAWALCRWVFEVTFVPLFWPNLIVLVAVTLLTVVTGSFTSWGITRRPPLEVLRGV